MIIRTVRERARGNTTRCFNKMNYRVSRDALKILFILCYFDKGTAEQNEELEYFIFVIVHH